MQDELTLRPLCSLCKTEQLTDEEIAMYANRGQRGACWFCVARTFVLMENPGSIPSPVGYGRPLATVEEAVAKAPIPGTQPKLDPIAMTTGTPPSPGTVAPVLTGNSVNMLSFNDTERKQFALQFGVDPLAKVKPTEVIAYGATEDTYLKFSIPLPITRDEDVEIQRLLKNALELLGKFIKYGPQFAASLQELQSMGPEQIIGGRR
jgi:hypothetical protein